MSDKKGVIYILMWISAMICQMKYQSKKAWKC